MPRCAAISQKKPAPEVTRAERGKTMNELLIGSLFDGSKCVYEVPPCIKNAEQFQSLIEGFHRGKWAERTRPELWNQPKLLGLNGPMWNGWATLKSTGERVAVIRYEQPSKY